MDSAVHRAIHAQGHHQVGDNFVSLEEVQRQKEEKEEIVVAVEPAQGFAQFNSSIGHKTSNFCSSCWLCEMNDKKD